MRLFLRNWAILTLIMLALVITFPEIMRQIFGTFHGLGIVPVCMAMVILALLPGRFSSSKAGFAKSPLATSHD